MFIIIFIIDIKNSKYIRDISTASIYSDKVIMIVVTRAQQFLF